MLDKLFTVLTGVGCAGSERPTGAASGGAACRTGADQRCAFDRRTQVVHGLCARGVGTPLSISPRPARRGRERRLEPGSKTIGWGMRFDRRPGERGHYRVPPPGSNRRLSRDGLGRGEIEKRFQHPVRTTRGQPEFVCRTRSAWSAPVRQAAPPTGSACWPFRPGASDSRQDREQLVHIDSPIKSLLSLFDFNAY